jgi:LemA protein
MDPTAIVVLVIVAVIALAMLLIYNGLVQARLKVREAWSGVGVQLQRRAQLVPNLVETVRGYASHERQTFESVTAARTAVQGATTPGEAMAANNQLTSALRTLFAVAEAYPDLKANQGFLDLQAQLAETEDKIAYARNYYNAVVREYNGKVATVPSSFVAGAFGFKESEFFEADEGSQAPVKVSFS